MHNVIVHVDKSNLRQIKFRSRANNGKSRRGLVSVNSVSYANEENRAERKPKSLKTRKKTHEYCKRLLYGFSYFYLYILLEVVNLSQCLRKHKCRFSLQFYSIYLKPKLKIRQNSQKILTFFACFVSFCMFLVG